MNFVSVPSTTFRADDDTPPLTRSRSSSASSVAAKSTTVSSSPGRAVCALGVKMSNTTLNGPVPLDWEIATESANIPHRDGGLHRPQVVGEHSVKEESVNNVIYTDGDCLEHAQRGWPGHQARSDRLQAIDHSRPIIERQNSYSKRHSSFNTRREMPYSQGHFGPHLPSHPFPSKDTQDKTQQHPLTPLEHPVTSRTLASAASDTSSQNQQSNSPQMPDFERISSHSLPIPDSIPFSALPTISSLAQDTSSRYTNPRTAPSPPLFLSKNSSDSVPSLSTLSQNTLPSRQSPSPPLLVADEDIDLTPLPSYPYRFSEPLPPRVTSRQQSASSRPASLPHALTGSFARSALHGACPNLPPPQPPTILTPPPLSEAANRKPAPHEPFLPKRQPSSDHTYIAVETFNTEYILVVRLPGFQRDAITLAARRRRVLHVVADDWNEDGGHFERRITFGYDADLYNVKAEFDGEFLRIHVPRKYLLVGYGRSVRSVPVPAPAQ